MYGWVSVFLWFTISVTFTVKIRWILSWIVNKFVQLVARGERRVFIHSKSASETKIFKMALHTRDCPLVGSLKYRLSSELASIWAPFGYSQPNQVVQRCSFMLIWDAFCLCCVEVRRRFTEPCWKLWMPCFENGCPTAEYLTVMCKNERRREIVNLPINFFTVICLIRVGESPCDPQIDLSSIQAPNDSTKILVSYLRIRLSNLSDKCSRFWVATWMPATLIHLQAY